MYTWRGSRRDEGEERKLLGGEVEELTREAHLVRVLVDLQLAETDVGRFDLVLAGVHARAAKHGLDPRRDLPEREGLHDVVIGPELQTRDALGFEPTSGEKDDRHVADEAKLAQHLSPVFAPEHDVEQDELGFARRRGGEGARAVRGDGYLISLIREEFLQKFGDFLVVVDDKDPGHRESRP